MRLLQPVFLFSFAAILSTAQLLICDNFDREDSYLVAVLSKIYDISFRPFIAGFVSASQRLARVRFKAFRAGNKIWSFHFLHCTTACYFIVPITGFTDRHASFMRKLLIAAGDIEENPGPGITNWKELSKPYLIKIHNAVISVDEDELSDDSIISKPDLLAKLETFDAAHIKIALKMINVPEGSKGIVETSASFSLPENQNDLINLDASIAESTKSGVSKGIKLPEFDQTEARYWFGQIEQILAGNSESIRKKSLMRSIPAALLREAGVDTAKSFDEIKRCVISYFDDSEDQRLKKMLQLGSLGDMKPSAVLRRLREMAPGISDRLVRSFYGRFARECPNSVGAFIRPARKTS